MNFAGELHIRRRPPRWGDPIAPGLADFDPRRLTPEEQARRFGYNNDYIAYFPLDATGKRGLLCVNHEYTSPEMMFAGIGNPARTDFSKMDRTKVAVEMAAHGVSVIEIARDGLDWRLLTSSPLNRRITASTPMTADGPAAGNGAVASSSKVKLNPVTSDRPPASAINKTSCPPGPTRSRARSPGRL